MRLKIAELAHQRGMTMADIAKEIGISRVNLSNSLNGNPTLSRLVDVAKILHVDVADLFEKKPKPTISGYLEYDNKVVKIDSVERLRMILAEIDSDEERRQNALHH